MSGSDCKVKCLTFVGEGVTDAIFLTCRGQVMSVVYLSHFRGQVDLKFTCLTCRGQVVSPGLPVSPVEVR